MSRTPPPRRSTSKSRHKPASLSAAEIGKARLLIVEDDRHTQLALQAQVEAAGFVVVGVTGSGAAAVELAQSAEPDLVLMDIVLEGDMDGIECATQIHANSGLPVLYLTSSEDREHIDRAKITQPFAYLLKPVSARELALMVEMALYRHRLEARLRDSEKHLAEAQRIGRLGSWDWEIGSDEIHLSMETYRIFGLPMRETSLTVEAFIDLVYPEDRHLLRKAIESAERSGSFDIHHRILKSDGQERVIHHTAEVGLDHRRRPRRMTGTLQDVTELKSTEAKLWHIAHHDPLCDLPNRMLMYDRLSHTLTRARRNKHQVALVLFDLDNFKQINDTYGHQCGDEVLICASERLRHCVRDSDTIARLAGDEFTIIIDQLAEPRDAAIVSQKIIDSMQEPINLDGRPIVVTCSIGIALYPKDAEDMEALLKAADQAMYESKRTGKNAYHFYSDVKRKTH